MDCGGVTNNSLAFPLDAEYINSLYEVSMGATRKEGLENGGRGKEMLPVLRWRSWGFVLIVRARIYDKLATGYRNLDS